MNRQTMLILNHLQQSNFSHLLNRFNENELREYVLNTRPAHFNAVWHNLLDIVLLTVDWSAILHYFNNKDWIDNIRAEQEVWNE